MDIINISDQSRIIITDKEDNLTLYHYDYCDNNENDNIKFNRGVIKNGDKIICKSFNYTNEYISNEIDKINSSLSSFNHCKFYLSEEGCIIRVFYYNDKWYISTHKKINAFKSYWGEYGVNSFGDMFVEALSYTLDKPKNEVLKFYLDTLNKNKIYTYLVRFTKYNKLVCNIPSNPKVYFTGAFDNSTFLLVEGNDSGINMSENLKFENLESLIEYVNKLDIKKYQGIFVYINNQTQIKIYNKNYYELLQIRGNVPSIIERYIQLFDDKIKLKKFYSILTEENIKILINVNNIIEKLYLKIHKAYITRFINKVYIRIPPLEHLIMSKCHSWHLLNRGDNIVTLDIVKKIFKEQNSNIIFKIVINYLN